MAVTPVAGPPATQTPDGREIDLVYGNGFQIALSNADLSIIMQMDNVPQIRVAMSFTTAKTMMVRLQQVVSDLEKSTKHVIMTSDEVGKGLKNLTGSAGKR